MITQCPDCNQIANVFRVEFYSNYDIRNGDLMCASCRVQFFKTPIWKASWPDPLETCPNCHNKTNLSVFEQGRYIYVCQNCPNRWTRESRATGKRGAKGERVSATWMDDPLADYMRAKNFAKDFLKEAEGIQWDAFDDDRLDALRKQKIETLFDVDLDQVAGQSKERLQNLFDVDLDLGIDASGFMGVGAYHFFPKPKKKDDEK